MLPETAWKKQHSLLQEDAANLSILKKQISKQSEIDATVQSDISQKIAALKEKATALAKNLQKQKHKNAELEFIIGNMRGMGRQKSLEGHGIEISDQQNMVGLENKQKKLQYDLGQLNSKANRIGQNVEDKRQFITQNRTERVIDSGIFRNIEIELIQSQLKFKKLLLEKVVHEKEYRKELACYQALKAKALTFTAPKEEKPKATSQQLPPPTINIKKIQQSKKFTNVSNRNSIRPSTIMQFEEENQFEHQRKSLVIKKMLIETGISTWQDLVGHFLNIGQISDRAYNQMNACITQCTEIEDYLEEAEKIKNGKRMQFYHPKNKVDKYQAAKQSCVKVKQVIQSVEKKTEIQTQEITSFFTNESFQKLAALLGPSEQYIPDLTESHLHQLASLFQALSVKAQQILGCGDKSSYEEKVMATGATERSKTTEKLSDLINKMQRSEENLKVMKREDFQQEYKKIIKNSSKHNLARKENKRKSNASLKH